MNVIKLNNIWISINTIETSMKYEIQTYTRKKNEDDRNATL